VLELWQSEEPSFHGRFFQIDGLAFEPKPVQQPHPPIYVGGNSKAALRRAARFDGWQANPTGFPLAEVPELIDYIRSQPDFAGKEETFEVCWVGTLPGLPRPVFAALSEGERSDYLGQLKERLVYLRSLGVNALLVPVPVTHSAEDYLDFVRWFDEEVIAELG
jgi:alkanesulfonate monooxygenase SsuD/methylene tetrahydromethanopterin reductase-like flavin-dependent oxidoreductase (luciferase family)